MLQNCRAIAGTGSTAARMMCRKPCQSTSYQLSRLISRHGGMQPHIRQHACASRASAVNGDSAAADSLSSRPDFEIEMQVRDYEIDFYGVVNNAVYANYLQHARHEFLESLDISPGEVALRGEALALTELNMRFATPLRSQERFLVDVRVGRVSAARFTLEQHIRRITDGSPPQTAVTATAVVVVLDENYRPKRISKEFKERLACGNGAGPL